MVLQLLQNIQQLMISAGNLLEQTRGADFPTVHEIEGFCEEIYQAYTLCSEEPSQQQAEVIHQTIRKLAEQYFGLQAKINETYLDRKEILIIPYRAKYWYAIKTVYEKFATDDQTDVYVISVPLHHRAAFGEFIDTFYEGNQYPEDVPITDYRQYDVAGRVPDQIYIQSAFDGNNPTISIDPAFYSDQLAQCTPCLIFAPWMLLDENLGNDWLLEKELQSIGCQPGVVHADQVLLQSENIRDHFLNVLKEFAGEAYLPEFEKKLVTDNYPVLQYIDSFISEDDPVSNRRNLLIEGNNAAFHDTDLTADYTECKWDFYYISVAGVLYEGEAYLKAMTEKVEELASSGDVISLVVEARAETTLKTVDSALYDQLFDGVRKLSENASVTVMKEPETPEEQYQAVSTHDQYFGDQGPVTWLFQHFSKPVQINTIDYNKM